ncbi:MAG: hypothetical protein IKJ01_01005 [Lachnospiraceae bacterium]|nr:hypothetical protein [Lachnospiraceae bacterium]
MDKKSGLFANYKECTFCHRVLPKNYPDDCCPSCLEAQLFSHVKEFIRNSDVNEYQVAEHFGIPIRQVKNWIKDGRIEYTDKVATGVISGVYCQNCGAPISFGSLCPKCTKQKNNNVHGYNPQSINEVSRMRFLDNDNKKQ